MKDKGRGVLPVSVFSPPYRPGPAQGFDIKIPILVYLMWKDVAAFHFSSSS